MWRNVRRRNNTNNIHWAHPDWAFDINRLSVENRDLFNRILTTIRTNNPANIHLTYYERYGTVRCLHANNEQPFDGYISPFRNDVNNTEPVIKFVQQFGVYKIGIFSSTERFISDLQVEVADPESNSDSDANSVSSSESTLESISDANSESSSDSEVSNDTMDEELDVNRNRQVQRRQHEGPLQGQTLSLLTWDPSHRRLYEEIVARVNNQTNADIRFYDYPNNPTRHSVRIVFRGENGIFDGWVDDIRYSYNLRGVAYYREYGQRPFVFTYDNNMISHMNPINVHGIITRSNVEVQDQQDAPEVIDS